MQIKSIRVNGFGPLKNLTLKDLSQLNWVCGLNGSGKTMLAHFIVAMLYGFEAWGGNQAQKSERRKSYFPWSHRVMGGQLYIIVDGQHYLITVQWDEVPRKDQIQVYLYDEKRYLTIDRKRSVGEQLLGISAHVFRMLCFAKFGVLEDGWDINALTELDAMTELAYPNSEEHVAEAFEQISRGSNSNHVYSEQQILAASSMDRGAESATLIKTAQDSDSSLDGSMPSSIHMMQVKQAIYQMQKKRREIKTSDGTSGSLIIYQETFKEKRRVFDNLTRLLAEAGESQRSLNLTHQATDYVSADLYADSTSLTDGYLEGSSDVFERRKTLNISKILWILCIVFLIVGGLLSDDLLNIPALTKLIQSHHIPNHAGLTLVRLGMLCGLSGFVAWSIRKIFNLSTRHLCGSRGIGLSELEQYASGQINQIVRDLEYELKQLNDAKLYAKLSQRTNTPSQIISMAQSIQAQLNTECIELQRHISDLEREYDGLGLLIQNLKETLRQYQPRYLESFKQQLEKLLSYIFQDADLSIVLDDDYAVKLCLSSSDKPFFDESCLSDGQHAQLKFMKRIAMLKVMKDLHPSDCLNLILLDDPFVGWDGRAFSIGMQLLTDLKADGYQVWVFSSSRPHRMMADEWQVHLFNGQHQIY